MPITKCGTHLGEDDDDNEVERHTEDVHHRRTSCKDNRLQLSQITECVLMHITMSIIEGTGIVFGAYTVYQCERHTVICKDSV